MTPQELYEVLDNAGVEYEIVEIFDGTRLIRIEVTEEKEND
jgi:hypothetical protein